MENGIRLVFLLILQLVSSKDPKVELPLCPTNIQFLPQSLPMHCRMPRSADYGSYPDGAAGRAPTMPPFIPPYYQSPSPEKAPPFPFPVAPPYPMMPGLQMPGAMPGPMSAPMPPPMPMPLNHNAPAHKLPVIVMPFYSPDPSYINKKHSPNRPPSKPKTTRRPYYYSDDTDTDSTDSSSDTDTDSSGDSSDRGWWKSKHGFRRSGKRSHKHRARRVRKKLRADIVTPVLQYVNRNGYVIFEKKITKGEAKDWLNSAKQEQTKVEMNDDDDEGIDMNYVQGEKPKEKLRPEEKPYNVNPPFQQQAKKHRQPKLSKEMKQMH